MANRLYTVSGKWPFPLDMLRHDLAAPATDTDRDLIARMSGDATDPELGMNTVTIALRMEGGEPVGSRPGGRYVPNEARWKSFGWVVAGGGSDLEAERARARATGQDPLHVAQLTEAEVLKLWTEHNNLLARVAHRLRAHAARVEQDGGQAKPPGTTAMIQRDLAEAEKMIELVLERKLDLGYIRDREA